MRHHTFSEWLTYIESLHPAAIELGLNRIREVIGRLQRHTAAVMITVGGTNGKGSTCAYLEAILLAAGYRVGCYTSPHLIHFNERVRLDGKPVDDGTLIRAFERVEAARGSTGLTFFEFTTAAAWVVFSDASPDVIIWEVGLGGRLDAVNVFDADCMIVTSIDIDHTHYLGSTRDDIGREKAGIFRENRPAICADPNPPAAFLAVAHDMKAQLVRYGVDFSAQVEPVTLGASSDPAEFPLAGPAGSGHWPEAAGTGRCAGDSGSADTGANGMRSECGANGTAGGKAATASAVMRASGPRATLDSNTRQPACGDTDKNSLKKSKKLLAQSQPKVVHYACGSDVPLYLIEFSIAARSSTPRGLGEWRTSHPCAQPTPTGAILPHAGVSPAADRQAPSVSTPPLPFSCSSQAAAGVSNPDNVSSTRLSGDSETKPVTPASGQKAKTAAIPPEPDHLPQGARQWTWWRRRPDGSQLCRHSLPLPGMRGAKQLRNAAAAMMALDCLGDRLPVTVSDIRAGLTSARLPGRQQCLSARPLILLDVAHNVEAIEALVCLLEELPPARVRSAVFGMLKDKAIDDVIERIRPHIDIWHVTTLPSDRTETADRLASRIQAAGGRVGSVSDSPEAACRIASAMLTDNDRMVIFGSFVLAGRVLQLKNWLPEAVVSAAAGSAETPITWTESAYGKRTR